MRRYSREGRIVDPFQLRKLGRSELSLPQLGFGGAPLGELFVKVSEADAEATLVAAWAGGVRYYDTAPLYGHGQSEHRIGRFLYRQPRSDVLLSTKVGRLLRAPTDPAAEPVGWVGGLNFGEQFDYSYDGIMRSYEDSLQRLGMTRVDLLIIHDLDIWHQTSEARLAAYLAQLATSGWRALAELKAAGRVKAIGAGINELGMIPRFVDLFDLDFFLIALRYTLGDHSALAVEMPLCASKGIGVVIGAVFSSGLYATGPVPDARFNYLDPTPEERERARQIEAICKRHNVPLAAAALQFPLHHPLVASVIPGAFQPDHVTDNIRYLQHEIPDTLWAELKRRGLIHQDAPTP
jgi:D-threo-aldose 1-dehydrogenase